MSPAKIPRYWTLGVSTFGAAPAPEKYFTSRNLISTSLQAQRPLSLTLRRAVTKSAVKRCCSQNGTLSWRDPGFWTSKAIWTRSAINTFRCLVGCTSGDFSTMWYLQSAYPELDNVATMSVSSESMARNTPYTPLLQLDRPNYADQTHLVTAGIMTSILLETTLLHFGRDRLLWKSAARTATGMSMISMLAMEAAENVIDYSLTGGCVDFESPYFWMAAGTSAVAGFLFPLPYNYFRLRAYRKSCH
ncbi:hypothetical protein AYO20_11285 [Fonsecaea nubica]|uniref:DUF4396 domain-containing protein n=1 Tax=Fonsecaea nubica TaxID=856822 RepID=A0A178BWN6_9EURO|nr:hypothetical protein AYO20_11285 [Fonsecaea nubica]OAL22049.1 hypothetical protein AYO20_11285 [Fonsecaea nubica]